MFKDNTIYQDILEKYDNIRVLKEKIAALPPKKLSINGWKSEGW